MTQMIMIKPEEAKIMQLYLLGNDIKKISEQINLSEEYIGEVLLRPHISAGIKDIEIEDLTRDNKLKKIKGAKRILDKVIEGAEKIANEVESAKWNKNHVELFKLLINDLAKEEKNIINNIQNQINIQNNTNTNHVSSEMETLDELIEAFPSDYQDRFRNKVLLFANELKNELDAKGTKLIVR